MPWLTDSPCCVFRKHCRNNRKPACFWLSTTPASRRRAPADGRVANAIFDREITAIFTTKRPRLPPGIAWCTVRRKHWLPFIQSSNADRVSATAWLAAATCIALREQKRITNGKVLLNIQVQRSSLEHVGGFGFAAGSLLIPLKLSSKCSLSSLARSISDRLTFMINRGWNDNFERLLGNNPQRHRWFSWLDAHGWRGAIVSLSWKDYRWEIDGHQTIQDIACFALSPTLHISGHCDRTGVSLSVTSGQAANEREDLLSRLVNYLSEDTVERILSI